MILEDAHWTDPTSLEVFGQAVSRIATLRVLLIVTFRPEFDPAWIGRTHVTALTINRLGEREVGTMIDRVVGNKPFPARIREDIIERTDGIPLFVEEMTKAVLAAESEGDARRSVAAIPSPALAVPASLHASLMARLDRLDGTDSRLDRPYRTVAVPDNTVATVYGNDFAARRVCVSWQLLCRRRLVYRSVGGPPPSD